VRFRARRWAGERLADEVLNALVRTPGPPWAEAALRAACARWTLLDWRAFDSRRLASELATWQPPGALLSLLASPPAPPDPGGAHVLRETLRLLGQELALRDVGPLPPLAANGAGSWCPLVKLASERLVHLPGPAPAPAWPPPRPIADDPGAPNAPAERGPSPAELAAKEPFGAWPNGSVELRVFEAPAGGPPLRPGPGTLGGLGLACLDGADAASIVAGDVDFARAFALLFGRLEGGGMYREPLYAGAAREAAWRVVHALLGGGVSTVEEVEARALGCSWYEVGAKNDWFDPFGFAVAVARPSDGSLALLAVTDSD
jgi:hypothetical protein